MPTVQQQARREVTIIERERRLREIARLYILGKIDYQTLTVMRRSIDDQRGKGRPDR